MKQLETRLESRVPCFEGQSGVDEDAIVTDSQVDPTEPEVFVPDEVHIPEASEELPLVAVAAVERRELGCRILRQREPENVVSQDMIFRGIEVDFIEAVVVHGGTLHGVCHVTFDRRLGQLSTGAQLHTEPIGPGDEAIVAPLDLGAEIRRSTAGEERENEDENCEKAHELTP